VPTPPSPPDLVLRLAEPPAIYIRRRPLADLLTPAYDQLGGSDS
jgi:hypothetical protein